MITRNRRDPTGLFNVGGVPAGSGSSNNRVVDNRDLCPVDVAFFDGTGNVVQGNTPPPGGC